MELSLLTGNYQVRNNGYRAMIRDVVISHVFLGRTPMLWLIWIAIMLLTPILAGVGVWRQTHVQPREGNIAEAPSDSRLRRSA